MSYSSLVIIYKRYLHAVYAINNSEFEYVLLYVLLGPTHTNPVCSKVSGVTEKKRRHEIEESPYCTGLGAITRERYKQKNTMLRDPYVIKERFLN